MLQSYGLAVSSAITAAMTLRVLTNPFLKGRSGIAVTVANSIVNYGAVGLSASLNVYLMRRGEMEQGISVMDPETNEVIGTSKIAAETAVNKTISTRWMYTIPIFFAPPILLGVLGKMKMLPKRAGPVKTCLDVLTCTAGLFMALPVVCGAFP